MSQQPSLKRSLKTPNLAVDSSTECSSTPHKRRRQTNQALEALGQLVRDASTDETDNKLNKNDVLSLTLARLLRRKYWPSNLCNRNVQLASDIQSLSTDDDLNGFIIVLNTKGRIILMSDNVEYYLRKNVRALYPQLTSIYQCVSKDDHESIRHILSRPTDVEQRVVCTWNLPRGKRPSRNHTESKSMLMTGHFCFFNEAEKKENQEPLFVATCEQVLSSIPNVPANSIGSTSTTTLRFVLTDQLNITEISSNTESLLGYKSDELIDQSINRFIPFEHLHMLEQARQNCILGQHYTTMNVIDLYTCDGDRLTFLCNTHMLIEGRRKAVKLGFLAQLIDPLVQNECVMYANKQNLERLRTTVQQEAMLISNINLNTSGSSNISPQHDQCINLTHVPTFCPATIIPQRRKRRRLNLNNEYERSGEQLQETPQLSNDFHESYASSSDSLTSSSPIQELGYNNDLLRYFDDVLEQQNIKHIHDFPSIDDVNDFLGMNNNQSLFLLTPTMSTLNFFA